MRNISAYFSMRAPRADFSTPNISPMKFKYWMPVKNSYRSGLSGIYAVTALQATGCFLTDLPSMKISPSSNSRMPVTERSVVVLPAPFCPMNP